MKEGLQTGDAAEFQVVVTEMMRPSFDGHIIHNVMSTVSMVYYMEKAGRELILPYLEVEEEGVGFALDIEHTGPAVIGQTVHFNAICKETSHRRVICDVIAATDSNIVGQGTFTQVIVLKRQLLDRIKRLEQGL